MKFYTTEKLGPKRSMTPDGFMVCHDVPIARTGEQLYGPNETPVQPGPDGVVHIMREPDEVFAPITIASFNGKPVTNDHPPEDVTPHNYKTLAIGHVLDPRRVGDWIVADMLITDHGAMKDITDGKREVSCGYDCDWMADDSKPGWGYQANIRGNHVALVDRGRCGESCSILDSAHDCNCPPKETPTMAGAKRRTTMLDWFRRARDAKDETELKKIADESEKELEKEEGRDEEGTHIHVHNTGGEAGMPEHAVTQDAFAAHCAQNASEHTAFDSRLNALEGRMATGDSEEKTEKELKEEFEEEAPEGTGDEEIKGAKDSALLEPTFQATLAAANILAPGIRPGKAFDRAFKPGKGIDAICQLRKDALTIASIQPDMQGVIRNLNGGKAYDSAKMTCGAARALFRGAVEAKKAMNTAQTSGAVRDGVTATAKPAGGIQSIAEWNRANEEFYKGKGANN